MVRGLAPDRQRDLALARIATWVPVALVAVLAARVSARERWVHAALVVALLTLAAAAIVVVDRASLSLFPGPDFNPAMVLR